MKRIMLSILIIATFCMLLTGCAAQSNGDTGITGTDVGNLAPEFSFANSGNGLTSLKDMRGSPVVLNFWASWCGPCRSEMPYLQDVYEKYQGDGLYLYAINLGETAETAGAFVTETELSFPSILDINMSISVNYDVSAIPVTFFIDSEGVIQGKKIGSFSSLESIESYLEAIL